MNKVLQTLHPANLKIYRQTGVGRIQPVKIAGIGRSSAKFWPANDVKRFCHRSAQELALTERLNMIRNSTAWEQIVR